MRIEYMKQAPDVLRGYFGYLETVKGKSSKTVEEYFLDIRTFLRYLKISRGIIPYGTDLTTVEILDVDVDFLSRVTLTEIFEFMNYTASERKNDGAARSRKSSALRSLFDYLTNRTGLIKENPTLNLDNPKLKSVLPKFLSLEQSRKLLEVIDGPYKARDYCIVTLFLNCGMRLSELVGINLSDILDDNRLRITGKGNKQRIVYLNDACNEAIKDYLKVRPVDCVKDRDALFISRQLKRISPKTVQYLVKKYLSEIGLDEMSVHKLRHTAATLMYQHGNVDIRILQDILGHENLGTTQIYTHISDEQMKQAALSNPLSSVGKKKK